MPTIARLLNYRFFFYSNEAGEPRHIHVQQGEKLAKFWLEPVALARSTGFAAHQLRQLAGLVHQHEREFIEAWNDFFDA